MASLSREYGLNSGIRRVGAGREVWLPGMRRPTRGRGVLRCGDGCRALPMAFREPAQTDPPSPPTSRGENFSAKPAPALFHADCTGAGCHKGPQGLAKGRAGDLAGFLREHYTNSRESAAALAAYMLKFAGRPSRRRAARTPAKPRRRADRSARAVELGSQSTGPGEARPSRPQLQQKPPARLRSARAPTLRLRRRCSRHPTRRGRVRAACARTE